METWLEIGARGLIMNAVCTSLLHKWYMIWGARSAIITLTTPEFWLLYTHVKPDSMHTSCLLSWLPIQCFTCVFPKTISHCWPFALYSAIALSGILLSRFRCRRIDIAREMGNKELSALKNGTCVIEEELHRIQLIQCLHSRRQINEWYGASPSWLPSEPVESVSVGTVW